MPLSQSIHLTLAACLLLAGCRKDPHLLPSNPISDAARAQVGVTVEYDGAYEKIGYPMGDVPRRRGVCTDVAIRALREGRGLDLQQLIHEDMKAHFSDYPKLWGLTAPDPNIDHRRVPNLQTWFKRRGWELEITSDPNDYQPGDLVTCKVDSGRPHIMVVSNRTNSKGTPLVLHNLGHGTKEENVLFTWKLTGHYRIASEKKVSEEVPR